jgi:uncharacterized YccA/Bax inhibitor family protein
MSNPVRNVFYRSDLIYADSRMTLNGSLTKIAYLLGTLFLGGAAGAYLAATQSVATLHMLLWAVPLTTFIVGITTYFKPEKAYITGPIYAFGQGVSLTIVSLFFESLYPGIAVAAVSLTGATALAMLLLYKFEIIKVTEQLRSLIVTATAAIALVYLVVFVLSLFGANMSGFFTDSSVTSIIFSLIVVGIAAFNLLLDFQLIEEGAEQGLPRYMEWFAAFNLLVTLVWLYLEILKLLAKTAKRK